MKKIVLIVLLIALTSFLFSCVKKPAVIPDRFKTYILEIYPEASSDDPGLVLVFNGTECGYIARIAEPEELSGVAVCLENGAVTLNCGSVELPFSEKASEGLSVIFLTLDRLFTVGLSEDGNSFDIGRYRVSAEQCHTADRIDFTVTDGTFVRSFIMRSLTENETERYPESSG